MCFSATASFTAAATLLAIGTVTAGRARSKAELPFSLIPVLFGVQQLVEGVLWLTFASAATHANVVLTHAYSFFSHAFWPMYVPFAVLLIERVKWRRKLLFGLVFAGAGVGIYLLYFLVTQPIVSRVAGGHILYTSPHFFVAVVLTVYVLTTCASSFISSHPAIRWFGVATFFSLTAAAAFYANWFISVWCFFAAVLSVFVLLFFVKPEPMRTTTKTSEAVCSKQEAWERGGI